MVCHACCNAGAVGVCASQVNVFFGGSGDGRHLLRSLADLHKQYTRLVSDPEHVPYSDPSEGLSVILVVTSPSKVSALSAEILIVGIAMGTTAI